MLTLVPLYAWLMTRVYQAKLVSGETLLLLRWWFVATVGFASFLASVGAYAAALAFIPYAAFLIILLVSVLALRPRRDPAVRLLLLRTVGARRRSTRLLREVARQWRWVGSVELITAPELATEALDPDEFLDFIRFRLSHRFVRDQSTVGRRLAELDVRSDRDGRYRINELMCHDDTWRPAVEAMISSVDVILLDLRGFGAQNAGVVEELERLASRAGPVTEGSSPDGRQHRRDRPTRRIVASLGGCAPLVASRVGFCPGASGGAQCQHARCIASVARCVGFGRRSRAVTDSHSRHELDSAPLLGAAEGQPPRSSRRVDSYDTRR